jgi:hypothetical protein
MLPADRLVTEGEFPFLVAKSVAAALPGNSHLTIRRIFRASSAVCVQLLTGTVRRPAL